jgi:hypothetical protein
MNRSANSQIRVTSKSTPQMAYIWVAGGLGSSHVG